MEEMKVEFTKFTESVAPNTNSLGTGDSFFGSIADSQEKEPTDIYGGLKAGLLNITNLKLVDYSHLKSAVDYFRPIINGFLTILLGMYWYKELLSFLGQAHNMASAHNSYNEHMSDESKVKRME